MTYNKTFNLNPSDIDVIEICLRKELFIRLDKYQGSVKRVNAKEMEGFKQDFSEITELLGKIHNQKIWFDEAMHNDRVGEKRPRDAWIGQDDAGGPEVSLEPCRLEIDGKSVEAMAGETILAAARRAGIDIPAMCADPRIKPTGVCEL